MDHWINFGRPRRWNSSQFLRTASCPTMFTPADQSDPLKVLLDLAAREAQHHRPAVGTDRRIGGPAQLVEDVRHLLVCQRVVRLHRRVARHGRGDALDRVVDARAAVEPFEILGQRAQRGVAVLARRAAPETRSTRSESPPNSSTSNPSRSRSAACDAAPGVPPADSSTSIGIEQALAFERAARQPLGDALEQHALVRDVLIDDRDALVVDGDDERVAELARAASSAGLAPPLLESVRGSVGAGASRVRRVPC